MSMGPTPSPARRQTPGAGEIFLDHLGWFVPDIAAASAAFERTGFRLSPYTVHRNEDASGERVPTGTANRCAMLGLGYLEVLTAVAGLDTAFARQVRAALDRYTGIHLIAFACADPAAERARLAAAGMAPEPPAALRRPITTDAGEEAELAFTVLRLPAGAMPEGRIQMLRQETPDLVWQPSLIARDNGAAALAGVVVCAADPAEAAARFARFTGKPASAGALALDRGRVDFLDPAACRAAIPGIEIPSLPFIAAAVLEAAAPDESAAWLRAQGLEVREVADGVMALPLVGATLVLKEPAVAWP